MVNTNFLSYMSGNFDLILVQQIEGIFIEMLPFAYVTIPLIILSLYYERKKRDYQYEHGLSRFKATIVHTAKLMIQKLFSNISWLFLSVSLSSAFASPFLLYTIMGIIYGYQVTSLLKLFALSKGFDIDDVEMLKVIFKFLWSRITGNFDETFDNVVKKQKPKQNKRMGRKTKSLEREVVFEE